MNCKFHPTAEAVMKCGGCDAPLCKECAENAFFVTEDDKPLCLECSLKEAEADLYATKSSRKTDLILGLISGAIWVGGVLLVDVLPDNLTGLSFLIMFVAALVFNGVKVLFGGGEGEKGFFNKIKGIVIGIIIGTLLLPLLIFYSFICNTRDISRLKKKLNKIKNALGI